MSKNIRNYTKDPQILLSEGDEMMSQEENSPPFGPMKFEPESHRDSALLSPTSFTRNPEEEEDDDEKNPIQKNFLSYSSLEVDETPRFVARQGGIKLREEKKKKIKGCFKEIKRFLAMYCEATPEACHLRERLALVLTVFICSKMVLEAKKLEKIVPQLFLASYCCLGYQIFEKVLLHRLTQMAEHSFDLANKVLLAFGVFIFHLQHNKLINERYMAIVPFLFLIEIVMYGKHCLTSQSREKDKKMIWRVFCLFQTAMIAAQLNNLIEIAAIAAKVDNFIDIEWKETLVFTWFYLGVISLYAPFAVLILTVVILASVLTCDMKSLRLLGSKSLGYIWNICWNLLNPVALIIMYGFFKKIESEESKDDDIFELGLILARKLSMYLMAFSALFFLILRKSKFNIFQDLGMTFQSPKNKDTLEKIEDQNKIAFFLMVPSTHLNRTSQGINKENICKINKDHSCQNKEQGNLCKICENNISNVILAGCGHGKIYKIENNVNNSERIIEIINK